MADLISVSWLPRGWVMTASARTTGAALGQQLSPALSRSRPNAEQLKTIEPPVAEIMRGQADPRPAS